MNTDRLKLQRTTLEKIKKINDLQKEELIKIVTQLSTEAVSIVKTTSTDIDDVPEVLTKLLVESNFGGFKRIFVQQEVGVSLNTLNALWNKGVLSGGEQGDLEDVVYWKWTGEELK